MRVCPQKEQLQLFNITFHCQKSLTNGASQKNINLLLFEKSF